MNNEDYTIDNLIDVFNMHHQQVLVDMEELKRKVEEGLVTKSPWMDNQFSMALALQVICKELKRLREMVE